MNGETESKTIDISFFIAKYFIPLVERKWIVIGFFLSGALISLVILYIVKPEYVSQATVLVEEPRSQSSKIKEETVGSRGARGGYIIAEAERLKSSSFAAEVFRILPDKAKEDFKNPLDLGSQLMGRSVEIGEELSVGEESEPSTYFLKEGELLAEMFKRIEIRANDRAGLIYITVRTINPENAPIIIRSYIDVWQAANLDENKKVSRAETKFAEDQRNAAYRKFLKTQEEMISFKEEYDIPVELNMARDMDLQSQIARLNSRLKMDNERFDYLDRIYLENRMKEAGIQGNIKIISRPALPESPSRRAVTRLMGMITMSGLMLGIGIILILDYLKAPIRHENDITSVVRIPVLGNIPSI